MSAFLVQPASVDCVRIAHLPRLLFFVACTAVSSAGAAPNVDGGTPLIAADADAGTTADAAPVDGRPLVEPADAPVPPAFDDAMIGPATTTTDLVLTFIKTVLMLCVVLALAWLTLSKGMGKLVEKAQAGKRVKVLERIALDARRSLFLVEIDGKMVVLAGGDVVKVHELSDKNDKARFAEVLAQTPPPPSAEKS
jgi:flagellar biogenesis protein FliO